MHVFIFEWCITCTHTHTHTHTGIFSTGRATTACNQATCEVEMEHATSQLFTFSLCVHAISLCSQNPGNRAVLLRSMESSLWQIVHSLEEQFMEKTTKPS